MSNEKVNGALAKGQEFYNKGNELMDKVPVLKNPLYKKLSGVFFAWCFCWLLGGSLGVEGLKLLSMCLRR